MVNPPAWGYLVPQVPAQHTILESNLRDDSLPTNVPQALLYTSEVSQDEKHHQEGLLRLRKSDSAC